MRILFKNIKELIEVEKSDKAFKKGVEMKDLPSIKNAFLLIENETIADLGHMDTLSPGNFDEIIDLKGKMVLPSYCDSHSHIVYAGNREQEFVQRIKGMTYEEIAQKGGGILNSAQLLQETSEETLYEQASIRLKEVMRLGTGAIEIKSGYGLNPQAELKMLRVIKSLKAQFPIAIKSTLLAAHALPLDYKNRKQEYIDKIIQQTIPMAAKEGLADFIDVFCETGYFSVADTEQILEAGNAHGLRGKIHVNQFTAIGGVQAGVKHKARSVDHLELIRTEDIATLKDSNTMPVALPSCSYFLSIPYTPARKIMDAGLPLALASDYNPGSSPSGNMNFVVSTACIKMKMTPEEAINAATLNGAYAMGLEKTHGSISVGKKANFIITKQIPSYGFIPYSFGTNHIDQVYLNGNVVD